MDDEYYYHGVKLLAMAVKGSERRKGIGTDLLKTICMQSDCSGCSVELVANGFDVKIEDDDDPRRRIDAINEGIGFRDLRFTDKEQRESRRLRRWYKRFGFREAVPPPNASFFRMTTSKERVCCVFRIQRVRDTRKSWSLIACDNHVRPRKTIRAEFSMNPCISL